MPKNVNKTPQEIRAEQAALAKKAARKDMLTKVGIWVGVVVALGSMVVALAHYGTRGGGATLGGGTLEDPITSADHTKGPALPRVTLVEYADFQCPACASYHPFIKTLADKYSDRVQFVFRHYPLTQIHRNAYLAAAASEAAGKQGKFWEMHDMLFENQRSWSTDNKARDAFIGYAERLGLNKDQFSSDLGSAETNSRVERDLASGSRANVQGTPTFYLNNQKLNLSSYGDLEQSIEDALAAKE